MEGRDHEESDVYLCRIKTGMCDYQFKVKRMRGTGVCMCLCLMKEDQHKM